MQEQLSIGSVSVNSDPQLQLNTQTSIETHIVERGDIYYTKGRNLAKAVYKEVWNTKNLVDGNDYAIVVACNGEVLGNVNIQLKHPGKLLKSEIFFGESHWESYFDVSSSEIAEISALAISQEAPTNLRRPIMMMLITGIQNLCRIKQISKVATVQHDYLIRILTKSLKLPFFKNCKVDMPTESIPNDDYWKRTKAPALYYLETMQSSIMETCYSFLSYLNFSGIQTTFLPRVKTEKQPSYAAFRKEFADC